MKSSASRAPAPSQAATPTARPHAHAPNPVWRGLALRDPGAPLPDGVRGAMETRFGGRNFTGVRVHADSDAAASADALDAGAYTVGHHIVFGPGRFAPHTPDGTHLLAHELAHVVQQGGAAGASESVGELGTLPRTRPGDPAERAADTAAHAVSAGRLVPEAVRNTAHMARPTLARQPRGAVRDRPAPPATQPETTQLFPPVHSHVPLGKSWIDETIEYDTAHLGEYVRQGSPERQVIRQKRLRYSRTVHVETDDGITATMRMTGLVVMLPFEKDAPPAAMLDAAGRGYADYVVRGEVMRGAMRYPAGFDFAEIFPHQFESMRAMAGGGPAFLHFGLDPAAQVDTLVDEIRRHLPKEAKRPDTISDEDYKRLSEAEHEDLAREALGKEFSLPNIVKNLLIGLAILAAIVGLLALIVESPFVALGILIAAGVAALIYLFRGTIQDALRRFADSDVFGAILTILKGLAIAAGIFLVLAALVIDLPVTAAVLVALAAAVVIVEVVLAFHDYQRAKSAPDLQSFHRDIQSSARGFEGSVSDAILAIIALALGPKGSGQRTLPPGSAPKGLPAPPRMLPPGEPVVIRPPEIVPAPAEIEIPQVAPAAPPVEETPQVAGPTVMEPSVEPTPAAEATGGPLRTTPMRTRYQHENEPGNPLWAGKVVRYLTPAKRAQYRLTIRGGKIYDANGALFDTSGGRMGTKVTGRAIFVVDENGYFYASNYTAEGEFHHSSFLAGEPVAAAGEMQVENGTLKFLNDHSGHYWPDSSFTDQAIEILRSGGVDMDAVTIERRPPAPPRAPRPGRRRGGP